MEENGIGRRRRGRRSRRRRRRIPVEYFLYSYT
jgi:hypothetical protein